MNLDQRELVSFIQRLVNTPSVTGEEKDVIAVLATEMTRLGFDRVWVDEPGSLIGIIEGKQAGPTLLMDGHCDTVGADPGDWSHAPWNSEIADGRLYGRGSADMKGSLAAMIYAAAGLERKNLNGNVAVSATVSEELVEGGTLRRVMDQVQPDAVIIGEATELKLNHGGRGRAELLLTTYGKSAHSSSPSAGRCAITDMVRVIQAIADLTIPVDSILGPGSFVLTDIISEPYPGHSVIPYRCHTTYDRRLLQADSLEGILNTLRTLPGLDDVHFEAIIATEDVKTYTGTTLRGEKFFPAWVVPQNNPLVQKALAGLKSAGQNPSLGTYRFCTNAAYCAGIRGIPTVGYGIGREEDAHIVDESISLDELHAAVQGYQGIILSVLND